MFLLLCSVRSFVREQLLCIAFGLFVFFSSFLFFFALLALQTTAPMKTENK